MLDGTFHIVLLEKFLVRKIETYREQPVEILMLMMFVLKQSFELQPLWLTVW